MLASFQFMSASLTRTAELAPCNCPRYYRTAALCGQAGVLCLPRVLVKLDTVFGISSIRPRIWGYYFDESNGANYTVIGSSAPATDDLLDSLLVSGSYPQPG